MHQNKGWRSASNRFQYRPSIPNDGFSFAIDCGVRSLRSNLCKMGIPATAITAATTHNKRQSMTPNSITKIIGKTAWPAEKPRAEIDSARPRAAENQRAIATTAMWLVMPCPKRRSAKITKGSKTANGLKAMNKQASASSNKTAGPSVRTRNLSVRPPAHTITTAEAVVPKAYIPPQEPWLRPNSD